MSNTDFVILKNSEADCEYIHSRLREYNRRYYGATEDFSFHIEQNGRTVAGIVAEGVCDTLEIEYLFVEEPLRKTGAGSLLIARAEDAARAAGYTRALVNTYSYQAPGFYIKRGYTETARVDPCFGGHIQHFFVKQL